MERLIKYFKPERYILDLTVDKKKKYIGGEVTVVGEVLGEVVKFHAVNMKIKKVVVDEEEAEFEHKDGVLNVNVKFLKHNNKNLKHTFKIFYDGKLNENMEGAYLSTYEYNGKTETIVATQFESHYAREAFPCVDEPEAKAVFELSITTDSDDLILTNVALGEPTPRMSTYLLAFVIGKFHGKTIKNKHGVEITTYCSLAQDLDAVDFANEVAARSLEFYDDNFGIAYPLKKLDQVALPDFEAGAMENWGLVTYRESMMLAGKTATLGTKKSVALTVAHELSHQWFGDLVTMEWWDDLWLNESFASVMEYYAVDYAYPEFKIFEGFYTGDSYLALLRDAYEDVQSVHQDVNDPAEIATLFDSAIVYSKGARLMLMLIRAMGWEKFCEGIKDYFEKFQYQNTIGDDLWEALAPYAEFDVKKLMHAFIDRPGYPVVMEDGSQKRFLIDGELRAESWPIPKITEDMSGHYILDLTDKEFAERLGRFDELDLEGKIRLLVDRNLVAKTSLASSASLLALVSKFKNENSAAVWGIILSIISGLKIFFEPDSKEETSFKKFVGELVKPKLTEIGLFTRKTDDENTIRLRVILRGLDFYAETKENIKKLAEKYNEDYGKIDAEIREDVLDAKLYLEPELIDKYLEDYQKIADPEVKFELLFAGTIMKDGTVLDKMVKLLDKPEVVKPQDQLYLYVYLYRNPKTRERVFSWLKEHWEYVKGMAGDKSLENYPRYMANTIRTEKEFKDWQEFFGAMKDDPAMSRAIKIGTKEIKARLKTIEEDKAGVYKALAG
ncbi:M1 family metallopeptidase [Candidatus Saccharibacteria bacterium]|nr:M1 family metallopeptidase [Candidatus Saccharibacteria bacterium]